MQTFEPRIYASEVIADKPENFTGVEINGVRVVGKAEDGTEAIEVDNVNPEFVSAYVRHKDGRALCVADFGSHAEAASWGRQLAARYIHCNWTFDCPLSE